MKHTFDGYEWDGDDNVPAQFSVDIPDRIYLQITDEDGSEFSETVIRDDGDRTFCEDRINQTDVEYVHHKLYAAALARAEAAEAERDAAFGELQAEQAIIAGDIPNAWGLATLRKIKSLEAENAELRAELARLRARLEEYESGWRPHPDATAGEEGEA